MALLKGKYIFWILAFVGCLVFMGTIITLELMSKITRGENGQAAIEMLDAMRRPLLEIKAAENQLFLSNDVKAVYPIFSQAEKKANSTLIRYKELTQYNPVVSDKILQLSKMHKEWIAYEHSIFNSYEKNHIHKNMATATLSFLNVLDKLGEGEVPIHEDISIGRNANNTLRVSVILLFLYLTCLIIFQQRSKSRILQKAKEAAEETNRIKSYILVTISHEIRTPMNGVMGMLQLLQETSLSQEQQEYIIAALDSAHNMEKLINDMLDISKIEADKLIIEHINYDVRPIIEEVTNSLLESACAKKLELSCQIDTDVPTQIEGDPCRLQQILNNLISNAIKFTTEGKIIVHLRTSTDKYNKSMLHFEIVDTGIGISSEKQLTVFDSFTQVDESITRSHGGAGLGLAIVKGLVKQMGGQIGVRSTPSQGSSFYFTLPLIQEETTTQKYSSFSSINV